MTREEVLAMDAGPDMDALVAELVLGCTPKMLPHASRLENSPVHAACGCPRPKGAFALAPHAEDLDGEFKGYSTDIAAAWEVVEKLEGDITLSDLPDRVFDLNGFAADNRMPLHFYASFFGSSAEARASTAPLAICRAALLTTLEKP